MSKTQKINENLIVFAMLKNVIFPRILHGILCLKLGCVNDMKIVLPRTE